jgi:hypothetical protein
MSAAKLLPQYEQLWPLVALTGAGTPLIASHLFTSAWIYSKPGSKRPLLQSGVLALIAFVVTAVAAYFAGVWGAMLTTLIMEYVSFLLFQLNMEIRWESRFHKAGFIAAWPLSSMAIGLTSHLLGVQVLV